MPSMFIYICDHSFHKGILLHMIFFLFISKKQISTTPPVGISIVLSVVEPITTILGGDDLFINTGSTINLTCIVKHLPEPPPLIAWTHNGNVSK